MKKIVFQICAIMIMVFVASVANAQVVIGSNEPPSGDFSVLELIPVGKQGLRLPQMTFEQRIYMELSSSFQDRKGDASSGSSNADGVVNTDKSITASAEGLQIFNTSTGCVETWDGDEWVMNCVDDAEFVLSAFIINNVLSNVEYPASN